MVHPFEKAGLGKAPFHCVGIRENVYVTAGGAHRQPGGCCNYCGTGIQWEYIIKSSDGATFVVGSDCVQRTGEPMDNFKEVRRTHIREQRAIKNSVKREARQKLWDKRKAERKEERAALWKADYSELETRLLAYDGPNNFIKDMQASLAEWGSLTDNMARALTTSFEVEDRKAAQRQHSQYIGQPGDKLEVSCTVTFCRRIETDPAYWGHMTKYLVKLETAGGNQLTWWTSKPHPVGAQFTKFTVKAHSEYDGIKSTTVLRVK